MSAWAQFSEYKEVLTNKTLAPEQAEQLQLQTLQLDSNISLPASPPDSLYTRDPHLQFRPFMLLMYTEHTLYTIA